VDAVLRWLSPVETRPQAIDAALALQRSGFLEDDAWQQVLLAALRSTEPGRLTVSGIRLLATIGDEDDRQMLAILLETGTAPARSAAAEALAEFPQHVDAILAAAQRDPALFASAVRAVSVWRANVDGLTALRELGAPTAQEHRAGVLRIAATLSLLDLLSAAASVDDLALREAMLARAAERPMGPFLPGHEEDLATVGDGLLLLAETRLALKRPDLALSALEALPPTWPGSHSFRALHAHALALLWTNRIEAAAELSAPPGVWLDALELAIGGGEAHAPVILAQIRTRFEGTLTPEELERLEQLAALIPPPPINGQAGTNGMPGPP
jgi:hypothetical protein